MGGVGIAAGRRGVGNAFEQIFREGDFIFPFFFLKEHSGRGVVDKK